MISNTALKKFFWFFLKLAIAVGIIFYLVRDPSEIIAGFRAFDYAWLLPALLIYLAHMLICA